MPIICSDCSYTAPESEPKHSSQHLKKDSVKKIFLTHLYLYKTKYNNISDLEEALKMNNFIGMMWVNKELKKANKRERESSSDQISVADRSVIGEDSLRQQAELKF